MKHGKIEIIMCNIRKIGSEHDIVNAKRIALK